MLLAVIDEELAICRLTPLATVPEWAGGARLFSLTRTEDELSIICGYSRVPDELPPDVKLEGPWRALRVVGTLDFDEVGVLASLATPLADAGISIFVLSTYDTDYLLITADDLAATVDVLRSAGHEFLSPPSA